MAMGVKLGLDQAVMLKFNELINGLVKVRLITTSIKS